MTLCDATMRLLAEVQICKDMMEILIKQTELLTNEYREAVKQIKENGDNRE